MSRQGAERAEVAALQAALAAEHAAVYGYGVVGALLAGGAQAQARADMTGTRPHATPWRRC